MEVVAETEGSKVKEFVEDSVEMVADSAALNAKSAANTTEIEKQAVTKENTQVHALSNLLAGYEIFFSAHKNYMGKWKRPGECQYFELQLGPTVWTKK